MNNLMRKYSRFVIVMGFALMGAFTGVCLADDEFPNPVWFQNRVKINGNAIDDAGIWTSSGTKTETGAQIISGTESHLGSNTFSVTYDRIQSATVTGAAMVVTITNNVVNLFSHNPAANGTTTVAFAAPPLAGRTVTLFVSGTNPVGIAASGSWKSSAVAEIPVNQAITILSIATNWYIKN